MNIRRATHDDYEAVRAFTSDIWADRGGDYIPDVYHDWLEDPDETGKKTFLAEVDGEAAGIVQAVMLSSDEAWFHGMRVASQYRRQGVSTRLNEATFEWAREQGATVGRVMIFSWNTPSLGMARASGFEPITSFRFAHPDPDSDAAIPASRTVSSDPTAAWRYWTHSDARAHLRGLGLAPEESWSMRELTPADFEQFADETAVFAVGGDDRWSGVAYRTRTLEREPDDDANCSDGIDEASADTETIAEYGVGAWDDLESARALFGAIARDAARLEAETIRIVIPETARYVTDAAYAGAKLADEPDFALGLDLTGDVCV
ncbi:GNAT family N-acetyltransferase [Salinadaptatus halalkaliphilus]|uniref:GNAT family N-acetyltransferase n=1 Tax=Salinadaptatus halalkaliphilus TaxID=2419781 RepID=A0A4S3TS80_9EURY|nr:GNAT family N-acetyltransferase [Salinadaptatus halalkaliphilus]THE66223.1 GNAT family N-acetyltransferase [Salinadaptatus halalkaliphilus]